ncbi:MAG TPA: hypothetical protein DHV36_25945 [Desulfobacteraceae bacterium]|nr:hypothetical protein [Desulfobacteraceae bacterium]
MEQTLPKFCGLAHDCVDEIAGSDALHRLMDKRMVFIVGKGGTGKTSITAALGILAEGRGKRVLLVEAGDADHLGALFDGDTLPETPTPLQNNIWGVRINPRAVIDEYVRTFIPNGFLAGTISNSSLFEHLTAATPGLKEVMTLGQIWRWEQEMIADSDGVPRFDLILVDAPATGHGLSLLRVPATLLKMIQIGPIASQTRTVLEALQDPVKTGIVQVTLPEELPISETLEFEASARNELKMAHDLIFINCIYPDVFDRDEQARIQSLAHRSSNEIGDGISAMLAVAVRKIPRRNLQQTYIDKLCRNTDSPLVGIPFYFTGEFGPGEINDMATRFRVCMQMTTANEKERVNV